MASQFSLTARRILLLVLLLPILAAGFAWSRWQLPQCLRVVFSPNGDKLATITLTGGRDPTDLQIWDLADGRELLHIKEPIRIIAAGFSADGKTIATGQRNGSVKLWDVATGSLTRIVEQSEATVSDVCFAPDGKTLAAAFYNGTVKLWNLAAEAEPAELQYGGDVQAARFSPDGSMLALAGFGEPVQLWSVADGKPKSRSLTLPKGYGSIAFAPDGKSLATFDPTTRLITMWDIKTGRSVASIPQRGGDYQLAMSFDGQLIATYGYENACGIWNVGKGQSVAVLDGHNRFVWSIAFSPRDRTLATTESDGAVRLWDVATGKSRILFSLNSSFPWLTAGLVAAFIVWSVLCVRLGLRVFWKWRAPVDLALLAALLLTVIILRLVSTDDRTDPQRPAFLLLWTLLGSLLSLVLFWMSFGRTRWSLRLPGFVAGAALVAVWPLVIWRSSAGTAWQLIIGSLGLVGFSLVAGRILRLAGFRLAHAAERADLPQPPGKNSEHQIFLLDLVLWTVAIAVLCTVARMAQPLAMRTTMIVFLVGAGAFLSVSAVVAAWAVLGTGSVLWRFIVLISALAVCVTGHFLLLLLVPPGGPRRQFVVSPLVIAGFVGAALLIFRVHGYGLVRSQHASPISEPASQPTGGVG